MENQTLRLGSPSAQTVKQHLQAQGTAKLRDRTVPKEPVTEPCEIYNSQSRWSLHSMTQTIGKEAALEGAPARKHQGPGDMPKDRGQ